MRTQPAPRAKRSGRYDAIGTNYARHRRGDRRIARLIEIALGDARSVLDVGSGAGSYEPRNRHVVALEPSITMIRQRPAEAAPVIRGVAENLPFRDGAFDAAMASLTIHHWVDAQRGLREMARVAPRQVILTWDPDVFARFWLVADYVPELQAVELDSAKLASVVANLDVESVTPVPVPWNCTDGFGGAYWRRPGAYLDAAVRRSISAFALCDPVVVDDAMNRLRSDLHDGTWRRNHADLMKIDELDLGYRLVIATG